MGKKRNQSKSTKKVQHKKCDYKEVTKKSQRATKKSAEIR